jgi:hypothetical protein
MTTTSNISCLENIVVFIKSEGFLHARISGVKIKYRVRDRFREGFCSYMGKTPQLRTVTLNWSLQL